MLRVISALLCAASAATLGAQERRAAVPTDHSGAFIARLGTDTLGVERFGRSGNAYNVEQVQHIPTTRLLHTHLELNPAGRIGTVVYMHHRIGAPVDAPLLSSVTLTFPGGDSARVVTKREAREQARTVAARATMVPSLPQAWLPYEIAAMRLRAAGADSARMEFLDVSGSIMPVIVRRLGTDSMTFELPFLTYRARVDADGRVQSLFVPNGTHVERLPSVDVNALASRWHALDTRGRAMGSLSPLDTVQSRIGDSDISVTYSRPSARGRVVWGTLVPFDAVWRTGANAATVFRTSRDLSIGGTVVPAGSYTLFTLPTERGTQLILSRETMRDGAPLAGTAYDPAHDLARIVMETGTADPVEQFTIEIVPGTGNRGTLVLAWAERRMTVPLEAR